MNNFLLGLRAILRNFSLLIRNIWVLNIFRGFGIGFLVSTIMHSFLIVDLKEKKKRKVQKTTKKKGINNSLNKNSASIKNKKIK